MMVLGYPEKKQATIMEEIEEAGGEIAPVTV